jgi:hypothetical protein
MSGARAGQREMHAVRENTKIKDFRVIGSTGFCNVTPLLLSVRRPGWYPSPTRCHERQNLHPSPEDLPLGQRAKGCIGEFRFFLGICGVCWPSLPGVVVPPGVDRRLG